MIRDAVVLAAGMGTRLAASQADPEAFSKPLLEVGGRTLLERVLDGCAVAGVERILVVTGYHADAVQERCRAWPGAAEVVPIFNSRWQEPNGVSVLAAESHVAGEFFLMMADHLFDPMILGGLNAYAGGPGVTLAVDSRWRDVVDLEDATKVRREGSRIVAIGKDLESFDAVDCGLFRCTGDLFPALRAAARVVPPSLSHGLAVLLEDRTFDAMEIGDGWWQDVDTPEMARAAERLLSRVGEGA